MRKIILLLLAVSIYSFAFSASKSEIQLNLTNGNSYKLLEKSSQTLTQKVMGNDISIRNIQSNLMVFHVLEANTNDYLLEVSIAQMSMKVITPMSVIEFDSQKPATDNALSQAMAKFIGKPFQTRISKTGQILEIKGVDELMNSTLNGMSGLDDQSKDQMKQQIEQIFGPDALKGSLESIFSFYPSKGVKSGDTWKTESSMSEFPINIFNTWTLGVENPSSTVITGKSTFSSKGKMTKIMGFDAKLSVSGEMTSSYNLNHESGWIKNGKNEMLISGKVIIPKNDQVAEDMEVPVTLKGETTFSVVE